MGRGEWRGREADETEASVDRPFLAIEKLKPGPITVGGMEDNVGRMALRRGDGLEPQMEILGVVAAPVKTFRAAEPLLLAAPPEPALVRAQLEHRDLARLGVG